MYLNLIVVIYSRSFTLYTPQFIFADIKFEMKLFFMYILLYYNRYFWKISSLNGMKLRRKTKVLLPFYLSRKFILQEKTTQFFSLSSKKKRKNWECICLIFLLKNIIIEVYMYMGGAFQVHQFTLHLLYFKK